MVWLKYLITILLFYILSLLQIGLFNNFNLFGVLPNFIFILFFILLFFYRRDKVFTIFMALFAGFFLDVFSSFYIGTAIISFLIIDFFVKKAFIFLRETDQQYPIIYFIPLFAISFIFYKLFSYANFYFLNHLNQFGLIFLFEIIYNLLFAAAIFYVFKKIQNKK